MSVTGVAPQLNHLAGLSLAPGQVALWWLGQAGFVLRGPKTTVLVDPFLAEGYDRLIPPAFKPEQAIGVDVIACTHDHIDHLDADSLPGLAAASPAARIVVPYPIVSRVTDLGISSDRVIGARPGGSIALPGVTIEAIPAAHGVNVEDAYNFGEALSGGAIRYLGYIFAINGARIYHAGDTLAYPGLSDEIRRHAVKVALMPINGRDQRREHLNLVGNMDHRDAAHVAADAGVELIIPIHYDMFPGNEGYPAHLVDFVQRAHPSLAVLILTREHPFVYSTTDPRPED